MPRGKGRGLGRPVTLDDFPGLVERYDEGEGIWALVASHASSHATIRRMLTGAGRAIRSPAEQRATPAAARRGTDPRSVGRRHAKRREVVLAEIRRLREAGESLAAIGRAVGLSRQRVHQILSAG